MSGGSTSRGSASFATRSNVDRFRPAAPAPDPSAPLVLFAGRVQPLKGAGDLVDAVPHVLRAITNARFRIVGNDTRTGPDKSSFRAVLEQRLRQAGAFDRVEFTETVPQSDLIPLYQHCSVFVLPCRNDVYPNSVLEAMGCGRPCIVTSTTGVAELIEKADCGRVVPPENPDALARAMVEILNLPTRRAGSHGCPGAPNRRDLVCARGHRSAGCRGVPRSHRTVASGTAGRRLTIRGEEGPRHMSAVAVVDVILPAYNGVAMIRGALESALSQDVPLRVIVVDDGSSDESAAVARSYGPRVHVIVQENQGVSGARNTALAAATAPYVAFLDQDDVWRPGKLRRQVDLIERHPDVGMVFTDMTILEPNGNIIEDGFLASTEPYATLIRSSLGCDAYLLPPELGAALVRENFVSPSTALVRTRALTEIGGFDTQFRLVDDAECWMRLLHRWRGIAIEDRLVLSYAWGGNASFVKWRAMLLERIAIGEKAAQRPDLYPPNAASHFKKEKPLSQYRLGIGELRAGNVSEARSWFATSLRQGWRMGTALALFATALPTFARNRLFRLKRAAGWRWNMRVE